MASTVPKTIIISRAGSSLVNGTYSLNPKSKTIKYVTTTNHPISHKPMVLEIIRSPIPALNPKHTFFILQARSGSSPPIHYYVSKSPFHSPHSNFSKWECVAGLQPVPKLSVPIQQFNAMKAAMSTVKVASKSPKDDDRKTTENEISSLPATKRTFLTDTYLFQHKGHYLDSGRDSKHGEFIILDDTIFHPQGGGQPTDKGTIRSEDGLIVFNVDFVSNHVEYPHLVCHFGSFTKGDGFEKGQGVCMEINQSDRECYARIHSAGHLIDIGMTEIGKQLNIHFEPVKGYHFPKGAYVEYSGNIPMEQRADMKQRLQQEMDDIINNSKGLKIQVKQMDCEEYLDTIAKIEDAKERKEHVVKMKIDESSKLRVVAVPGFENGSCMCGGTHIDRVDRIKRINVTKFKKKNKNFRVSYNVE